MSTKKKGFGTPANTFPDTNRRPDPKLKQFTPAQEKLMETAEEYRCRARIIELGVCEFLREHGYTGATIAATAMLMDASRSRQHAEECVTRAKLNVPPDPAAATTSYDVQFGGFHPPFMRVGEPKKRRR